MKLNFVETSGRGIDIIYYSQARYGRPAPDYSASNQNSVIVRLVGGTANIEFCQYIMSLGSPSLFEMLILNALFYQRSMNIKEICELIQTTETIAKQIVSGLLQKDWIELLDEHNPIYFLKGTLKSTALRVTKSNQNEIKEKIIELLSQNKYISRNEIAKLLSLTTNQVYRLLSSLQKEGIVKIDGKKWILNH
jgi:ATP-dependent DNA helicase RecG